MAEKKFEVTRVTSNMATGEEIRRESTFFDDLINAYKFYTLHYELDKDLHEIAVRWKKSRPRNSSMAESDEFVTSFPCVYYGRIGSIEIRGEIKGIKDYAIAEYLLLNDKKEE